MLVAAPATIENETPRLVEPDLGLVEELAAFGAKDFKKCYQCATCSVSCSLSPDRDPFPRKEMLWAKWGLKDRLLKDADVWTCYYCGDCSTRCPRGAESRRDDDGAAPLPHHPVRLDGALQALLPLRGLGNRRHRRSGSVRRGAVLLLPRTDAHRSRLGQYLCSGLLGRAWRLVHGADPVDVPPVERLQDVPPDHGRRADTVVGLHPAGPDLRLELRHPEALAGLRRRRKARTGPQPLAEALPPGHRLHDDDDLDHRLPPMVPDRRGPSDLPSHAPARVLRHGRPALCNGRYDDQPPEEEGGDPQVQRVLRLALPGPAVPHHADRNPHARSSVWGGCPWQPTTSTWCTLPSPCPCWWWKFRSASGRI